jgi:hypothetical protein
MATFKHFGLPIAFGVSVVAIGIPYWPVPYSQVALPDTRVTPALLVPVLAASALGFCALASARVIIFVVGAALPAAVLARVIVETSADPTSHNLWPLEVLIALLMGLVAALAGALAGRLAARAFPRRAGGIEP